MAAMTASYSAAPFGYFYLSLLDKLEKTPDENPPIGIILCAEKDHLEVELVPQDVNKPIGVAEYQYLLPKNKLQELVTDEIGSIIILLTKREAVMISFFASLFYAVNAQISLVYFGHITNGVN